MADLCAYNPTGIVKALIIGDSGGGKTGGLLSLASEGYNLRILDYDNKLDILKNILASGKHKYSPDTTSRIKFKTFTEKFTLAGGVPAPTTANAWRASMNMLENWKDGEENLGKPTSWGPMDVLVIDSFSMAANTCYWHVQAMNGRLGKTGGFDGQRDIGVAQGNLEGLIQYLNSDSLKCNVIVISHIVYTNEFGQTPDREKKEIIEKAFPSAIGKALSPKIPRYFSHVLEVRTVGAGPGARKRLFTKTQGLIELKSAAPLDVAADYPIETGLAEYFKAVRNLNKEATNA